MDNKIVPSLTNDRVQNINQTLIQVFIGALLVALTSFFFSGCGPVFRENKLLAKQASEAQRRIAEFTCSALCSMHPEKAELVVCPVSIPEDSHGALLKALSCWQDLCTPQAPEGIEEECGMLGAGIKRSILTMERIK